MAPCAPEVIVMSRLCLLGLAGLLLATLACRRAPAPDTPAGEWAATFSIVAHDPARKEWGVAVASKYLAVGSAVPFARAGVGAVATQSFINVTLGPRGLELLGGGKSAEEALAALKKEDSDIELRQLALIDARGEAVTFTGKRCLAWAGGKTGKGYAVQGNILTGEEVVDEMAKAFEANPKWPLAWRLLAALEAGEKAGGDRRGKQSAALLVVRARGGPNGLGDRLVDLRVDDHKTPVQELARILRLVRRVRRPAE
jgi:uncharacterized Ntn-hydrolase superfamily protein